MKKLFAFILAALMLLTFVSCGNKPANDSKDTDTDAKDTETLTSDTEPEETNAPADVDYTTEFNITVIAGTTGMGFAKMMHDASEGTSLFPYNFELVGAADLASSAIIGGNADIAAVPTNLAAVLHAKTGGEIQVVAANTLGVLYLIENGNSVTDVASLAGKTVYCCQQGANPEYITTYILEENGLTVGTDVTLDFSYNTPDELMTAVASGAVDLAVLPEPKVTAALTQNSSLRVAIDFTAEWEAVNEGTPLIQGCIIATKSFISAHPAELSAFLDEYELSVNFTNENPETASEYMAELGIIPKAPLALKAIPNCNICFLTGDEMREGMMSFYDVLYKMNPASLGGAYPDITLFQ